MMLCHYDRGGDGVRVVTLVEVRCRLPRRSDGHAGAWRMEWRRDTSRLRVNLLVELIADLNRLKGM